MREVVESYKVPISVQKVHDRSNSIGEPFLFKERFSFYQNFFIVEKYIVANSIVVVKYLEVIEV